ncbi:MAG: hypothetical protein IJV31_07060 [Clostridia bacterium]|nr:hypothetical protein [Clostridia bacterium]
MVKNHHPKPQKLVVIRNNKITVFKSNLETRNIRHICNILECLNNLESIIEYCEKYPLTLKPFLIENIKKRKKGGIKWN